ncbi:hypothetical protein BFJ69_g16988 [Fusarium oxysporum]|uniref:Condensation domain-containing protein n=1 Tax=Fusarium oxysporum TaxID=5507 RepID=A0A420M9M1_FUSOX|nr:hypothetical protein BFJ69_g16988 [Fusarium oxysporum]
MIYSDPFSISDEVEARPDVTIASVVRAAWAFVVHQYTGTDGVVFGAPLAGRNMAVSNIDKIVGPIIATVPIRVRVPSGKNSATISAFLRGVQNAATAVIPFEQTSLQHMQNSVWKLNRPAVSRGYLW